MRKAIASFAIVGGALMAWATPAVAAPPQVVSVSVAEDSVTASGVILKGSVNPNGVRTTYGFEYITDGAYEANLAAVPPREPFDGASVAPAMGSGLVGSGTSATPVNQQLGGLLPATSYRFRLRAAHAAEAPVFSTSRPFATQEPSNVFELLDHRGWEMVSPVEKEGGAIQPLGAISGGGIFQAAAGGGSIAFSSIDSFGSGALGAPSGSQYMATRGAVGWTTANITTPLLSGSYGSEPNGLPYRLFSGDLGFGLISNGERCRGEAGGECPVANPPLPGSGAPSGYRDYYRRGSSGAVESILTAADLSYTSLGPGQFELRLVGATPDLGSIVLSSCAALTANAVEVAAPGGCNAADQNLYEWVAGALTLINVLPHETTGTPGAALGAPGGAISNDGGRVYWTEAGALYLTEAGGTRQVDEELGGGAEFQIASSDGGTAYLTKAGALYRYTAAVSSISALPLTGEVEGVLGGSEDGSTVYCLTTTGLFVVSGGTTTEVASSAGPTDFPSATGTARVSADGRHAAFLSTAELTGYPNEGETEVFLYGPPLGGGPAGLTCVSCDPTGEAPGGAATLLGSRPDGTGGAAVDVYKPRSLSTNGYRVFFESTDSLVPQDTDNSVDVYEWEAFGEGTCGRNGGCVQLISSGRDPEPSYFLDASADGSEAFFLSAASLYALDPGSFDVYDAREGGGFAVPGKPIPCVADACQILPEAPEDRTPGTLVSNSGNPALTVTGGSSVKTKRKKKHRARGKHRQKPRKNHDRPKHSGGRRR